MADPNDESDIDPIGALLDDVEPEPARTPEDSDLDAGAGLLAGLVEQASGERDAVRPQPAGDPARSGARDRIGASGSEAALAGSGGAPALAAGAGGASAAASGSAPAARPGDAPPPAPARAPSLAGRAAAAPPAPAFDRDKVERLILAGSAVGLVWFLVSLYWKPPVEPAPGFSTLAEALVHDLEDSLKTGDPLALAQELVKGWSGGDAYLVPEVLESAAFPGRETWNEAMQHPRELASASPEVRARFQAVAQRLAEVNRTLAAGGLGPAFVHAQDPLGAEKGVVQRLERHAAVLGQEGFGAPEDAATLLSALRDCTRSISRRAAGRVLNRALDLDEELGWAVRLAPRRSLLGVSQPDAGDVSPLALTTAYAHLAEARAASRRGERDDEALLAAARLLVAGFPTPADPFGGAWARTAARLYALAGHQKASLEVAQAFCEKAAQSGEAVALGTALLQDLLEAYGKDAPSRLESLWSAYHGGNPPGDPGFWKGLEPFPRTPSGLMGQIPTSRRIQGVGKGDELSLRERRRRYARFKRRRGRP